MRISDKDRGILRELGARVAEIAADPVQDERRELWRRVNALERVRPPIFINEIPWWELTAADDELKTRCESDDARGVETALRRIVYQWEHFPGDMVVDPWITCRCAIRDTGYGMEAHAVRSDKAGMTAADYEPIIRTEEDIANIRDPEITVDRDATDQAYEGLCDVFDGVIEVRKEGVCTMWFAPWDQLVRWYGITELMIDMLDRPEFVHKAIGRMVDAMTARLDQYERLGVLSVGNGNHRVGSNGLGITDELPADDYDGGPARPIDQWGTATGQIFSEVSPEMHWEFCLQYEMKWLERFGLNNYGCCEPLHNKMHLMRKIPRLRKVSMSPWVDVDAASERMGKDFVFCHKPSPAVLATDEWRPAQARKNLVDVLDRTRANVVEVILKDISTVRDQPRRLWEWETIAAEVVRDYA